MTLRWAVRRRSVLLTVHPSPAMLRRAMHRLEISQTQV